MLYCAPPFSTAATLARRRRFGTPSTAEFTFKPEGDQTVVTWTMFGPKNFLSKAFCMFMSMDKMVGDQFEKGLQDLKKIVEAKPKLSE